MRVNDNPFAKLDNTLLRNPVGNEKLCLSPGPEPEPRLLLARTVFPVASTPPSEEQ